MTDIDWIRLNQDQDFLGIFTSQDSPLTSRIRLLETKIRDLTITDPAELMRYRAELHGILQVQKVVDEGAKRMVIELQAGKGGPVVEKEVVGVVGAVGVGGAGRSAGEGSRERAGLLRRWGLRPGGA